MATVAALGGDTFRWKTSLPSPFFKAVAAVLLEALCPHLGTSNNLLWWLEVVTLMWVMPLRLGDRLADRPPPRPLAAAVISWILRRTRPGLPPPPPFMVMYIYFTTHERCCFASKCSAHYEQFIVHTAAAMTGHHNCHVCCGEFATIILYALNMMMAQIWSGSLKVRPEDLVLRKREVMKCTSAPKKRSDTQTLEVLGFTTQNLLRPLFVLQILISGALMWWYKQQARLVAYYNISIQYGRCLKHVFASSFITAILPYCIGWKHHTHKY